MSLLDTIPIYVTRKTAGGETGAWSLSIWMPLVAILLMWLNVILWSVIGLIQAVKYFV